LSEPKSAAQGILCHICFRPQKQTEDVSCSHKFALCFYPKLLGFFAILER